MTDREPFDWTQECDQCGEKADASWTYWKCPRGCYPGDCDGKMVPLVEAERAWVRTMEKVT